MKSSYKTIVASVSLCLLTAIAAPVLAQNGLAQAQLDQSQLEQAAATNAKSSPEFAAVPFVFSSENLSTAFGGAGVIKHAGQVQASIFGIGLYSSNDSYVTYLSANNYQLPGLDQWLFSAETYQAHFTEGVYYLPDLNGQEQRAITTGDESFTKLHARYVLPIGHGIHGAAPSMLPQTDISWDPRVSGVSSVKLTAFTRAQQLGIESMIPERTQGAELLLNWDNRDQANNTTQGGETSFTLRHGFEGRGAPSWTTWELEQSAFFSLSSNELFRQQVMALNLYLADTPSWNDTDNQGQAHRPPYYAGIGLGGFDRLRGYSAKRFSGRSALLYSMEYRVQPHWQPLQHWPVFEWYQVPWWQWVAFAEAGQVSDEFSAASLHQDMHWTLGTGVRFEVESIVVRAEIAKSQESTQFWVMVSQPF
ncbi:MAG: hypothetical protein ACRCT7_17470 [Shewanella sp.]